MSELARTQEREGEQKEWMVRTLVVLQAPRGVFAALRDDSPAASAARSEAVLALVILAGMGLLLLTPEAGSVLDSSEYDGAIFAIWLFIVGGAMGAAVYWGLGAIVYGATSWLGSLGSYRRARHLVGFALAPLALSLIVMLPLRLAFFGGDSFRSGGSDSGTRGLALALLGWAFAAWAVALAVVGVRAVHAWTWERALAATGASAAIVAVIGLLELLVGQT
jgi:hypothetical protein